MTTGMYHEFSSPRQKQLQEELDELRKAVLASRTLEKMLEDKIRELNDKVKDLQDLNDWLVNG